MQGYTIDGECFLSKNWRKNKALWVKKEHLEQRHLFKTYGHCECSLYKLLEEMPEYKEDKLYMVYFDGVYEGISALTILPKLYRERSVI